MLGLIVRPRCKKIFEKINNSPLFMNRRSILHTACLIKTEIFQMYFFSSTHCSDVDQKYEIIVCSFNNENYDKLTWNI